MPSLRHWVAVQVLRLSGRKRAFASAEAFRENVAYLRANPTDGIPWRVWYGSGATIELLSSEPCRVYSVTATPQPAVTLLYLHGGCHTNPCIHYHWELVADLAYRANARVIMCLYPLAPEANCETAMAAVLDCYRRFVVPWAREGGGAGAAPAQGTGGTNPTAATASRRRKIFVGGDSAGGGKTLRLAQMLAAQAQGSAEALPQADGLILFSPWLDTSTTQPGSMLAVETEEVDPMLGIPGAQEAARMYAGSVTSDLKDPRVSPLYGSMVDLPPIAMWAGTLDILVHDARAFMATLAGLRAAAQGKGAAAAAAARRLPTVTYYERPDLFHVWMAAGILPEAQQAREEAAAFMRDIAAGGGGGGAGGAAS